MYTCGSCILIFLHFSTRVERRLIFPIFDSLFSETDSSEKIKHKKNKKKHKHKHKHKKLKERSPKQTPSEWFVPIIKL